MRTDCVGSREWHVPKVVEECVEDGKLGHLGLLRVRYLQANKPEVYSELLTNGKLVEHLMDVEAVARTKVELLLHKLLKTDPGPRPGAAQEAMCQHMRTLRLMAEETVKKEYVLK